MSILLCPKCSTRNQEAAEICRRCGASLGGGLDISTLQSVPQSTLKGIPLSESLVGGRWVVETTLDDGDGLFLARDIQTNQRVLIKRLSQSAALDRVLRSRFLQEARLLLSLEHPNVLRAIDLVEDDPRPGLVLQYHQQQDARLSTVLAHHERFPLPIALDFLRQLLSALEHVHGHGVRHRQLSPEAILVREDPGSGVPLAILTDFGLAHVRQKTASTAGRRSGTLMGMRAGDALSQIEPTPYMSPEMLSLEATRRSDLYSLGVVFFQMCTGQLPVASETQHPEAIARQIMNQPPTPLGQLLPHVSEELEELVSSLLHKDQRARPEDAREVLEALAILPEREAREMVHIPMGTFTQGSSPEEKDARREEQPSHRVRLDAFSIDRFPVTALEFSRFLKATGYVVPDEWYTFNDPEQHPGRPVVFVSWDDANTYATWIGKRLPTEAEWEKAARGQDGAIYPWGSNAPTSSLAWFNGKSHPANVDAHLAGASAYGVCDMAGNAFEWVADWYDRRYYRSSPLENPRGPKKGKKRVLKGGSFAHPDFALRCAVRGRYRPDERRANHSFRCAWSLRH